MVEWRIMRVLVTGATGFIGSHLCRALLAEGHHVRALQRPTSALLALEGLAVERVVGDLFDPTSLLAAMEGVEVVFHCAGEVGKWRDPGRMAASHVQGTRNVLQAAQRAGVRRVVHTSSVAALGVPDHRPERPGETVPLMDERHQWNANPRHWPYGYAKHMAEGEVLRAVSGGMDVVIVNPAAVFGAGDLNHVSSGVIWHMAHGRVPPIVPGGLNAVHIDDVVAGMLAALARGKAGERYILGGENLTHARLLATVAEVVGRPPPRIVLPAWLLRVLAPALDVLDRVFPLPVRGGLLRMAGYYFYYDTRKAQRELGVPQPRPFRQAAQEAYAWYQAHEP